MDINPSDFNRRVMMVSYTFTQGSTGGVTRSLAESFETWASVNSKSGSQYVTQGQIKNDQQVEIIIRYRPQITENWNVVYEGQTFIINNLSYDATGYKRFIILKCAGAIQQQSWS